MSAISCPHCRQPLTVDPALAGQVVACPSCSKKLRLPGAPVTAPRPPAAASSPTATFAAPPTPPPPPGPAPPAAAPAPSAPASAYVDFPKPAGSRVSGDSGSPFRQRTYPAMKVVIYVCYAFAVLTALSFVISEVVVISGGAVAAFAGSSIDDMTPGSRGMMAGAGIFYFLFIQVMLIVYHGLGALAFVAAAESIKVWLDIQQNTHEAAHFQKQLYYRQIS